MSHQQGYLKFEGSAEIFYFEYDGTTDQICRALKRTPEELHADWRSSRNDNTCTCDSPGEKAELAIDYGAGFHLPGKACRKCMCITQGQNAIDEYEVTQGLPDWAIFNP